MITEVLQKIQNELPVAVKEPFKGHSLANYIRNEGKDLIKENVPEYFQGYKFKGSPGESGWVKHKDCWIGVFNPEVCTGKSFANKGYYVVYGFPIDSRYVTFGINQSYGEAQTRYKKKWKIMLETHADQMRARIPDYSNRFEEGTPVYTKEDGERYYKSGFVYHKVYDVDNLPPEEELIEDLAIMLEAYKELFENGGRDMDADVRKQAETTHQAEPEEEEWESQESLVLKQHKGYERRNDNDIRKLKEKLNYPPCEICGFDFEKKYGTKYIEAHHIVPISEMKRKGLLSRKIKEKDIAMLCANCHRMIHRYKDLSVEDLKKLYLKNEKRDKR